MVDARMPATDSCLGLIEVSTVPLGCVAVDAMLKGAPLQLLLSRPVTPAKYIALVEGDVESVRIALDRGKAVAKSGLLGELFLPMPHLHLLEGLVSPRTVEDPDAVGILQTKTVASALIAADAALKTGEVELLEIRLAMGLGGHAFFTLTGEVSSVEAAMECGAEAAGCSLSDQQIIPLPDAALLAEFCRPQPPFSDLYGS